MREVKTSYVERRSTLEMSEAVRGDCRNVTFPPERELKSQFPGSGVLDH